MKEKSETRNSAKKRTMVVYILIYLYGESASPIGFQCKTATTTETYPQLFNSLAVGFSGYGTMGVIYGFR